MNTLIIDTSSNKEIVVGLSRDGKEDMVKQEATREKAQVVLPLIDQLLQKHKLQLQDINAIQVNTGPGSFTGLRVGVAIANTLGMLLRVPINDKNIGEFVEPHYS